MGGSKNFQIAKSVLKMIEMVYTYRRYMNNPVFVLNEVSTSI